MSLHVSQLLKTKTQTILLFLRKTLALSTESTGNTNSTYRVFVGNTTQSGPVLGWHSEGCPSATTRETQLWIEGCSWTTSELFSPP